MPWQDDPITQPGAMTPAASDASASDWRSAPITQPAPQAGLQALSIDFADKPWESDPIIHASEGPRVGHGIGDAFTAGYQGSIAGLADRGRLPDVVLDAHHAPWYEKLAASASQLFHEAPEMIGGFLAGGAAGGAAGSVVPILGTAAGAAIGGGAGAFAVPTAIREALIQAYSKGAVTGSGDFLGRTAIVLKQSAKDALIGGLTAGVGAATTRVLAPLLGDAVAAGSIGARAARVGTDAAKLGTEYGTLVVTPAALEGRLPEPDDFLNTAILLAGMHSAGLVAGRLRAVYAATGKTPIEVVAEAKSDPTIAEDLAKQPEPRPLDAGATGEQLPLFSDAELPRAYQDLAREVNATDAVPGVKADAVASQPFAEVTQVHGEPARPTEVNYNYINSTDDVKAAMARLSQVYETEIQAQRRGSVNWEQSQAEAGSYLADLLGSSDVAPPRQAGAAAGAAELLARKQMVLGAAEDIATRARELQALGTNATQEQRAAFLTSIQRGAMLQAEFLGARAEAGRALNILKDTRVASDRAEQIRQLFERFGNDPDTLASMVADLDNPAAVLKFARDASRASTWDKIIEAWKAGLVSGPFTQTANILGNITFVALRPLVDTVAAGMGVFSRSADRVTASEPLGRIIGNIEGVREGLMLARSAFFEDGAGGKVESQHAIGGTAGYVIRTPFRALAAGDAIFRAMNERGEAYTLAARQATSEGMNLATREWRERVAELAHNPTGAMQEQIEQAGVRFTFNAPLGEKGRAVSQLVHAWPVLQLAIPFIRTPANVFKEMAKLTPAAPIIGEWRAAIGKGGAEAQKAYAEMALGTALSGLTAVLALSGHISGAGDPDPAKRQVQMATGWQPYSVKVGDTWYSYQRMQPVGTLLGMAADMASVWDHMAADEQDKVPKILATAFANAVTNQTFLQGLANVVDAISDPDRKGPRFVQNLAASTVPALVSQSGQMLDPYVRQVDSIRAAVQARIPGLREGLPPQRDPFGEPIANREHIGIVSPVTTSVQTQDKVRTEAARLGFGVEQAPQSVQLPAAGDAKLGKVQLTPQQRDVFGDVRGHVAYEALQAMVNGPSWDGLPDMVKLRAFHVAFEKATTAARAVALPPEQRQAEVDRIVGEITRRMAPAR